MLDPAPTSVALDRIDLAMNRIETAAAAVRQQRRRAEQRFERLERGAEEALGALDALLAEAGSSKASAA